MPNPIRRTPTPPVILVLGFALLWYVYGLITAGVGSATGWILYRIFALFHIGMTYLSWRHAADAFDLEFSDVDADPSNPTGNFLGPLGPLILPYQPEYELTGVRDGRSVRVHVDANGATLRTVWTVDAPDVIPEWLMVRPQSVKATADRWLDVEDVKIGETPFDDLIVVAGPDADDVKTFFWEHDIADELVELRAESPDFEISDGEIRMSESGIARRSRPIRDGLERLLEIADRLEETAAADEATRLEETDDAERPEAAHVYE